MAPEQARGETTKPSTAGPGHLRQGSILCEILDRGARRSSGGSAIEILQAAGRADTAFADGPAGAMRCRPRLLARLATRLAALARRSAGRRGSGRKPLHDRLPCRGAGTTAPRPMSSRAAERAARAALALAKAAAERRARRLTGALAATVLSWPAARGAVGWRWVELQQVERVREASGRVNLALQ